MWSVGCIYAELLGMLEGNKMEDRAECLFAMWGRWPEAVCLLLTFEEKTSPYKI